MGRTVQGMGQALGQGTNRWAVAGQHVVFQPIDTSSAHWHSEPLLGSCPSAALLMGRTWGLHSPKRPPRGAGKRKQPCLFVDTEHVPASLLLSIWSHPGRNISTCTSAHCCQSHREGVHSASDLRTIQGSLTKEPSESPLCSPHPVHIHPRD